MNNTIIPANSMGVEKERMGMLSAPPGRRVRGSDPENENVAVEKGSIEVLVYL